MTELWRPVFGFPGYEVSDRGRVRSLPRPRHSFGELRQTRILKATTAGPYGHLTVSLYGDGVRTTRFVHRLVADAFLGPRPNGLEVCHNNGEATDNRLSNLRYDTHQANIQDSIRHGTHKNQNTQAETCSAGHPFDGHNGRQRICSICNRRRARDSARRVRQRRKAAAT